VRRWTAVGVAVFCLAGCANLRGPSTAVSTVGSESSVLRQAAQVAAMAPAQQQVVCAEAQTRLQDKNSDDVRLTLAALGVAVPGCLPPDDVLGLLKRLPDSPLAAYLRAVADRQAVEHGAFAQAQDKISSLEAKLKALTRIEQQINQVKDRELQDQGQGKTAPR
jgi:hypothetical protein